MARAQTYRLVTVALVAALAVGWGVYAGLHARHWLGLGDEHEPAPAGDGPEERVFAASTHLATQPFEAVLGPIVREAESGLTAGQAVEFDVEAPAQTERALVLLEWEPADNGAGELLVRVAWRVDGAWGEPVEAAGASPLFLEAPGGAGADAARVTILPAGTGLVVEQPLSGWLAFHRAEQVPEPT